MQRIRIPAEVVRATHSFVGLGIAAAIWFAAFARAGYDAWALTLLFGWLTGLTLIHLGLKFRNPEPIVLPRIGYSVALLAAFCASLWHSFDKNSTQLELWVWFFLMSGSILWMNSYRDEESRRGFFTVAGLIVLPLASIALAQQVTKGPVGYGTLNLGAFSLTYGHREIQATLINSIVFAGFVLPWTLYFWERARRQRGFAWLAGAGLLCLLLARSTTSFAALALGLFALYGPETLKRKWQASNTFRVLLVAVLLFAVSLIAFKFLRSASVHSYSSSDRYYFALAALRMVVHEPLTGVGLGGFATAYPFFKGGALEGTRFAHSFPLQVSAEAGFFGILALLLFLGRSWIDRSKERLYWAPLIAMLAYACVSFSFEYFINRFVFLLFLFAGLKTSTQSVLAPRRLWVVASMAALVLIAPFWLKFYSAGRLAASGLAAEQEGKLDDAARDYANAISIDRTLPEPYVGLARLHWTVFEQRHDLEEGRAACRLMSQAIEQRKDVHLMEIWKRYTSTFEVFERHATTPPSRP